METKCRAPCISCGRIKSAEEIPKFKKILDVKEIGLCIYQHLHRNPDASAFHKDVFIMCNKSCMEITNKDIRKAFDMYKSDCPRCNEVIAHLHNLLENITTLSKNKIIGICDHCKLRAFASNKTCECDKISKIFINVLPDDELTVQKNDLPSSAPNKVPKIRTEIDSKSTTKAPIIEPYGFPKVDMSERRGIFKISRSVENVIKEGHRVSMSVAESMPSSDDLTRTTPGKDMKKVTSYENINKQIQNILSSDKEFDMQKITAIRAIQGKKKSSKGSKLSFVTLARDFSITDYGKHHHPTPDLDNIFSASDLEIPISKIRKDFSFFFPKEKPKRESTIQITSAELIQATRDKIRMKEMREKERKNLLAEKTLLLDLGKGEMKKEILLDAESHKIDGLQEKTYTETDTGTEGMDDILKQKKLGTGTKYKTTQGSEEIDEKLATGGKHKITRDKETKEIISKQQKSDTGEIAREKRSKVTIDKQQKPDTDGIARGKGLKDNINKQQKIDTGGIARGKEIINKQQKSGTGATAQSKGSKEITNKQQKPDTGAIARGKGSNEILNKQQKSGTGATAQSKGSKEITNKQQKPDTGAIARGKGSNEILNKQQKIDKGAIARGKGSKEIITKQQKSDMDEKNKSNITQDKVSSKLDGKRQQEDKETKPIKQDKGDIQNFSHIPKISTKDEKLDKTKMNEKGDTGRSGKQEHDILPKEKLKNEKPKEENDKTNKTRGPKDSGDQHSPNVTKGMDDKNNKTSNVDKTNEAHEQNKLPAENKARAPAQPPARAPVQASALTEKSKAEKTRTIDIKDFKMKKTSIGDMTQLVKLNKNILQIKDSALFKPLAIDMTKTAKGIILDDCEICKGSNEGLDEILAANRKLSEDIEVVIIGDKVHKYKRPMNLKSVKAKERSAMFFKTVHNTSATSVRVSSAVETQKGPILMKEQLKKQSKHISMDHTVAKRVIQYALSDRTFIENGWTVLPTERVVRKLNVYRMSPAHPEFDWFAHNKHRGDMTYEDGSKFIEFNENGTGRWYYRNGKMALDYYDAEEPNAHQRYVVYSNGENDEHGNARPYTVLAAFDHLGNAIVYDHSGNIRMKYNQTEGILLDSSLGAETHWKWHTLNEPPILQQVMIDTYQTHKDPEITKLGNPPEEKYNPENEEMLAIEFENSVKEKAKKLSQKFKPFQIKMKALKINENFSLKVFDQANVCLIFRDGLIHLKLNLGMKLDHQEIIDTDTTEVGMVSTNMEVLPAKTDSLSVLRKIINQAQLKNKKRVERNKRLNRKIPMSSKDKLTYAASKPLQATSSMASNFFSSTTTRIGCQCSKYLYN